VYLPRIFIIAGITLIAIALAASGHGLWWLIGLVWLVGGQRRGWSACHSGRPRGATGQERVGGGATWPTDEARDGSGAAPDPTHDRHEAFPSAR